MGGNNIYFWSQIPPIYPNILHDVVALVVKQQNNTYKNKYETAQKLIYMEMGLFLCVVAARVWMVLTQEMRVLERGGGGGCYKKKEIIPG